MFLSLRFFWRLIRSCLVISLLKTTAITFLFEVKESIPKTKTVKNNSGKSVVFFIGLITLQNYTIIINCETKVLIFNRFIIIFFFFREIPLLEIILQIKNSKLTVSTWSFFISISDFLQRIIRRFLCNNHIVWMRFFQPASCNHY